MSRSTISRVVFALALMVLREGPTFAQAIEASRRSDVVANCPYSAPSSFAVGPNPTALATRDFNEDGILDVAVANSGSNAVSILLGNGSSGVGDGTFASAVQYWMSSGPQGIASEDFNSDGILDLAVGGPDGISLMLGNGSGGSGDGTFGSAAILPGSNPCSDIITGDFDEDGTTDLAVAAEWRVQIYSGGGSDGVGNGTFSFSIACPFGTDVSGVTAGDFNADGVLDLAVVRNTSPDVTILLGNAVNGIGDGTFAFPVDYPVGGGGGENIVTGDFNEDGATDLAVTLINSGQVAICMGMTNSGVPTGTFQGFVQYQVGDFPRGIGVTDVDGDGISDVVVACQHANQLAALLGGGSGTVGDGTFAPVQTFGAGNAPYELVLGDFLEDGAADVVVTNFTAGSVSILSGTCATALSTSIQVTSPNGGESFTLSCAACPPAMPLPGDNATISWTKGDGVIATRVELSRDGGVTWQILARNITGTSFTWNVIPPTTSSARVRVTDETFANRSDASDGNFSIDPCPPSVSAAWPGCGVPVAGGQGYDGEPSVTSDGMGGAFVAYEHSPDFFARSDIHLNHLDANGNFVPGWPINGVPVCTAENSQLFPRVVADGSGGALIAWLDTRTHNDLDVYLQRITASGSRAPGWPPDGLVVHPILPGFHNEYLIGLQSDGAGGAIVGWYANEESAGRVTRVTSSGTIHPSWPAGGLQLPPYFTGPLRDGAGGHYIWNVGGDLRVLRITPLGSIDPNWPTGGLVVANASPTWIDEFAFELHSGGAELSIAWVLRSTQEVRAAKITSSGTFVSGWAQNGVSVRSTPDPKSSLTLAHGGSNGDVVIAWREDLPSPAGYQVLAQRLTHAGTIAAGWPSQGWAFIPDGRELNAIPDCDGGTTVSFMGTGAIDEIRAIRFTPAATLAPGWPSGGVVLCSGFDQRSANTFGPPTQLACPDGTGGVITVPSTQGGDIYAQCARGDGTVNQAYFRSTPTGSNVQIQVGPAMVTFSQVTTSGETMLEVQSSGPPPPWGLQIVPSSAPQYYDITTTAVFNGPVQTCITYDPAGVQGPEANLQLLHYDATANPATWVNVTTNIDVAANVICGSTLTLSPFIVVEADPTDANDNLPRAHRLFANVPNPFNPVTTIRYEIPKSEHVRLDVHDVGGRLVRTLVNHPVEAGRHEVVWHGLDGNGRAVSSGVYFYRLQAGSFVAMRRMVLLK